MSQLFQFIFTPTNTSSRSKSSEEPLFHLPSILKYKNPLLSLLFSPFFQAKLLTFLVTVITCYYSAVRAASETDAAAGHFGSRAITNNLYTDDLLACQNSDHRARTEQFAHRNDNSHARQKDDRQLLIVWILSAADVAEKTSFLYRGNRNPKDENCWIACSGNSSLFIIHNSGLQHKHINFSNLSINCFQQSQTAKIWSFLLSKVLIN